MGLLDKLKKCCILNKVRDSSDNKNDSADKKINSPSDGGKVVSSADNSLDDKKETTDRSLDNNDDSLNKQETDSSTDDSTAKKED